MVGVPSRTHLVGGGAAVNARDEAIEAGAATVANCPAYCAIPEHGASQYDPQRWRECPDCVAAAVAGAVDPIIRADEGERIAQAIEDACDHVLREDAGGPRRPCARCAKCAAIARGEEKS